MTRATSCALVATLVAAGAMADAPDHEWSRVRTRSVADPLQGPGHRARLLIPPGADDVVVAAARERKARRPRLANAHRAGAEVATPVSDWRNSGGNAERSGHSSEAGPSTASLLWRGGPHSVIGWQAFTEGGRMFVVRQEGFPPDADSVIYALDLQTGAEIWRQSLPRRKHQFSAWIAGVNAGVVYASRSGARPDHGTRLFALDAATGGVLWSKGDGNAASAYDGVVFAANGDPIIGSYASLMRVDARDGSLVWQVPRDCPASLSCGAALFGDAAYIVERVAGGQQLARHDLITGARAYTGPVMPGFTSQNTPMVGPDGTVYFSRTEDNPATDFFYAFRDTGTELVERWHVPAAWTPFSEFAVGPDGSVYMIAPGHEIHRLDPATGDTLDSSPALAYDIALRARMAVDSAGRLYVSNGGFASGRLYAFTAELAPLWDAPLPNVNIGGPALGAGGGLVVTPAGEIRVYADQNARPSLK
jgi:outer membrane protein assembly factor BamB